MIKPRIKKGINPQTGKYIVCEEWPNICTYGLTEEENKKVYEILADDSSENTVYVLHEVIRDRCERNFFEGIFSEFEMLQSKLRESKEEFEFLEVDDYIEFHINKYILTDEGYKRVLFCKLDIDENLWDFNFDDENVNSRK